MKSKVFNKKNVVSGIVGGIIAGIVLGFLLMRLGTFGRMEMFIGFNSLLSGFLIQLVVSVVLGLIFALVFGWRCASFYGSSLCGMVYGVILWFLGPLTLCPWMNGFSVSWGSGAMLRALPLLIGYLAYGLVLGVVYYWMRNRK